MTTGAPRTASFAGGAVVVVATALIYAGIFPKGFQSETFLDLTYLSSIDGLRGLMGLFAEPLLQSSALGYFRPISDLFLRAQLPLWGTNPLGYGLTSLAVHCLNVVLVMLVSNRMFEEPREWRVWFAGLVFGLYPLAPNTVVFFSAGASMISTTFILASLFCYLRGSASGSKGPYGLSLVLFAGALFSYEAAIVLPALAVLTDAARGGTRRIREQVPGYCGFLAVLVTYFLYRQLVVGAFPALDEGPLEHILARVRDLPANLPGIVAPSIQQHGWETWPRSAIGLAVIGGLLALLTARYRGPRRFIPVVFGLAWILVAAQVTLHLSTQPALGRYWYLAAVGLAIGLGGLVPPKAVPAAAFCIPVLASYAVLLYSNLGAYKEAGELAHDIQLELARKIGPGEAAAVGGYPKFLYGARGSLVAQVYHWGLSDAGGALFTGVRRRIYPLADTLDPALIDFAGLTSYRWNNVTGKLEPVDPARKVRIGKKIHVLFHTSVLHPGNGLAPPVLVFEAGGYDRFRISLLAGANPFVWMLGLDQVKEFRQFRELLPSGNEQSTEPGRDALNHVDPQTKVVVHPFPRTFLLDIARRYPFPMYVWVDALGADGRILARSDLMTIEPDRSRIR